MKDDKSYSEMIKLKTFDDRLNYLKLNGVVSELTFGGSRYLNQMLYHSEEWKRFRRDVIIRDHGCDLADENRPINRGILIHHLNPITVEDVRKRSKKIFDMDNVVCTTKITHNAIHYGGDISSLYDYHERKPNDTCLWR